MVSTQTRNVLYLIYISSLLFSLGCCSVWEDVTFHFKNLFSGSMLDNFRLTVFEFIVAGSGEGKESLWANVKTKVRQTVKNQARKICSGFQTMCCDVMWLGDIVELEKSLKSKLHGQHLVNEVVVRAIRGHLRGSPKKALVLSFHGWTGGGKNFASKIIADHLFVDGMRSKFVHLFISTLHFPHKSDTHLYQSQLVSWIKGNISKCERSIFIFDEMDKMPPGLIDVTKPFLDYHVVVDNYSFNKAIFIFLSNTGGTDITKVAHDFQKSEKRREDITLKDMDKLLMDGAFSEPGGLQYSYIIQNNLVDFYVPFLPLERSHVKMCIHDEILSRGDSSTDEILEEVADNLLYYPPGSQLFSTSGCKLVAKKLDLITE